MIAGHNREPLNFYYFVYFVFSLIGADTVIFYENDWNPKKDLQAMDRAHRLGQKRTVNVYRLITRGTLEEKIMKLQDFKEHMTNTVITDVGHRKGGGTGKGKARNEFNGSSLKFFFGSQLLFPVLF